MEIINSSNVNLITIRISINNKPVGSGILVRPNENTEWVYLITAKHCLKGNKSLHKVSINIYNAQAKDFINKTLNSDCIRVDDLKEDLTIISIPRKSLNFSDEIPVLKFSNGFNSGDRYWFRGFPKAVSLNEPEEDNGILTIPSGRIIKGASSTQKQNESGLVKDIIKGFSGSGIFWNVNGSKILIGILTEYLAELNRFKGVNFDGVNELLKSNNLPEIFFTVIQPITSANSSSEVSSIIESQLNNAIKEYENFNPITARKLIEDTIRKIDEFSISIQDRKRLLARAYYYDALCQRTLESVDIKASLNLFIKAYSLNPEILKYKERAAQGYYELGKKNEALSLATKIIEEDPLNARAYALLYQFDPEIKIIDEIKNDPTYKLLRIHFLNKVNSIIETKDLDIFFHFEKRNKPIPDIISQANITYWWYVAQYVSHEYIARFKTSFGFQKPKEFKNNPELKYSYQLLEKICSKIAGTEEENTTTNQVARFEYYYIKYLIYSDIEDVLEMYRLFTIKKGRLLNTPFLNNSPALAKQIPHKIHDVCTCLLQAQEFAKVIEIIEEQPTIIYNHIWQFKGYSHIALKEYDKAINAFIEYIKGIHNIREFEAYNLFLPIDLMLIRGKNYEEVWNILKEGKTFKNAQIEDLLKAYCYRSIENKREEVNELCLKIEGHIFGDFNFSLQIAICYLQIGNFEKSINVLEPVIDRKKPSQELEIYIISLYRLRKRTQELLELLRSWRTNFTVNEDFIIIELEILQYMRDYNSIEEVSRWSLSYFPNNPTFWFLLIDALSRLTDDKKEKELINLLTSDAINVASQLLWQESFRLGQLCIKNNLIFIGKEIFYQTLKAHPQNPAVKASYFSNSAMLKAFDNDIYCELATEYCVVKLNEDSGKETVLELTPEVINSNQVAKLTLGKKAGDVFTYEKLYGKAIMYTVSVIFNKYTGQLVLFYKDIDNNPAAHPEIESIKIEEEGDIDNLFEQLINSFGVSGSEREKKREKVIQDFFSHKIGFTELSIIIQDDYLDTWNFITSDYQDGFPIAPLINHNIKLESDVEIVIDFSTIFTLIHLCELNNLELQSKPFLISQRIYDWVQDQINDLKSKKQSTMTMGVTSEGVKPIFIPEDFYSQKINKLEKVLDWIRKNTQAKYVPEMFEVSKNSKNIDSHTEILMENVLLASKPNRVLLTDDLFHYKYSKNVVQLISIESFFKVQMPSQYEEKIFPSLLKLNYRGLSISHNSLQRLFESNRVDKINLSDNFSIFNKCLIGMGSEYNPNPNNIKYVIEFLKDLYSDSYELWYKQQVSRKVLLASLKGYNLNIEAIKYSLESQFHLLGPFKDSVLSDLDFVLDILGNSNE